VTFLSPAYRSPFGLHQVQSVSASPRVPHRAPHEAAPASGHFVLDVYVLSFWSASRITIRRLTGAGEEPAPVLPEKKPFLCEFCGTGTLQHVGQIARSYPRRGPPLWKAVEAKKESIPGMKKNRSHLSTNENASPRTLRRERAPGHRRRAGRKPQKQAQSESQTTIHAKNRQTLRESQPNRRAIKQTAPAGRAKGLTFARTVTQVTVRQSQIESAKRS